jgi:hypothetical protein
MNGYSLIFMVVFIFALALSAGVLSWCLIVGLASWSRQWLRKHGHIG